MVRPLALVVLSPPLTREVGLVAPSLQVNMHMQRKTNLSMLCKRRGETHYTIETMHYDGGKVEYHKWTAQLPHV